MLVVDVHRGVLEAETQGHLVPLAVALDRQIIHLVQGAEHVSSMDRAILKALDGDFQEVFAEHQPFQLCLGADQAQLMAGDFESSPTILPLAAVERVDALAEKIRIYTVLHPLMAKLKLFAQALQLKDAPEEAEAPDGLRLVNTPLLALIEQVRSALHDLTQSVVSRGIVIEELHNDIARDVAALLRKERIVVEGDKLAVHLPPLGDWKAEEALISMDVTVADPVAFWKGMARLMGADAVKQQDGFLRNRALCELETALNERG